MLKRDDYLSVTELESDQLAAVGRNNRRQGVLDIYHGSRGTVELFW